MTDKLQSLLDCYDFVSDDVNVSEILAETIKYIEKLEQDYKDMEEIISIQRHNLSLERDKKRKYMRGLK